MEKIVVFERFNPSLGQSRYWFIEKDKAGGGPMFDLDVSKEVDRIEAEIYDI